MLLVADTSPLISFLLIERLAVLESLYPDFIFPDAVWEELQSFNQLQPYSEQLDRIKSRVRKIDLTGKTIPEQIDRGEMEAIALYHEFNADRLLIDDKAARLIAEEEGVNCIGTLTVLYQAKQQQLVPQLKPLFTSLRIHKRYFSDKLFNYFLELAGE